MRSLFCLALLVCVPVPAMAQCRGGSCAIGIPMPAPEPEAIHWRVWPANPQQAFLHRGNQVLGGFDLKEEEFRSFNGQSWGVVSTPPVTPPVGESFFIGKWNRLPTGVDLKHIEDGPAFTRSGKKISRGEVMQLFTQAPTPSIPDNATAPHLTVICKDQATMAKAKTQIATPAIAEAVHPFRLQVYDVSRKVDAIMLEPFRLGDDAHFQESGQLWIAQEPAKLGKGKVIFSLYGAQETANLIDQLRQADPSYKPLKKPAPTDPKAPDSGGGGLLKKPLLPLLKPQQAGFTMSPLLLTGMFGGGLASVLYLKRRRNVHP